MGLPLPKVVADVGPGGGLVTAMGGMNALANQNILRQINQIKKYYMPFTTQADINSKNAYAQLVGLQPFLKTAGNENLYNPLTEEQKNYLREQIYKAGGGKVNSGGPNSLNNMPQTQEYNGSGQPHTNKFSGYVKNVFQALLGRNQQQGQPQNAFAQQMPQQAQNQPQSMSQDEQQGSSSEDGINNINDAELSAYDEWLRSHEGQAEVNKGENGNFPTPQEALQWQKSKRSGLNDNPNQMIMELTGGQRPKTNAEKTGEYKATVKRLEKGGEYQAEALKDIGKSQLALSGQGAALDEMTKIITNPVWQHARDTIPAFQSQQLGLLKVTGSPEMKKLAGEYTSAAQSIIINAVASMGSKHLSREYGIAEKQKINDSDTIESAEGKMTNAKNLHDIAEKKSIIIKNLLKKGVDEADAVEQANKQVDVNAIRKATEKLLERKISITNNKTGKTEIVSVKEAQKRGVPNV